MTRRFNALADRMLAMVVPQETARAAACHRVSCFCRGISLYTKQCCDFQECGPCRYDSPAC